MGFIPAREARDCTTKILNLIHVATKTQTPCVFLSTDAEKALDRVNWVFMSSVLKQIGLGHNLIQWISSVYSTHTAQIKANGILSYTLTIANGTRQGCPLSPLLFALTLEPFLCTIRSNPDITGVSVKGTQYKISAYADDLMFTLTNPIVSLPNLLREFDRYGTLSNLKIYFDKSAAMGINITPHRLRTLKSQFKFKWSDSSLKYLGTLIPNDLQRTFDLNFPPLLTKAQLLLEEWNKGLHSWFGRCNLFKMCIFPKFLYLFQASPVKILPHYFKQMHSIFIKFIWAKSKPRLCRSYLTLPKHYGGLALPDLKNYYRAVHLGRIIDWNRHG